MSLFDKMESYDPDNIASVGFGKRERDGVPTGEEAVVVGVVRKKPLHELSSKKVLPNDINGYRVDVQEFGLIAAPPNLLNEGVGPQKDRTGRWRPTPLGVSVAHIDVTAGTTSFILYDKGTDEEFMSSNNHVIANMNKGEKGDPILQPGPHDSGGSDDKVAELESYIKVKDGVTVDLAWGKPITKFVNKVVGLGIPAGEPYEVKKGDTLIKSGRTSAITEGKVKLVGATVKVRYGDLGIIKFKDQIITTKMLSPGDSGSAIFYEDGDSLRPAGLGFAGSDRISVLNTVQNVMAESGLKVKTGKGDGDGNGRPTAEVDVALDPKEPEKGDIEFTVIDSEARKPIKGAEVNVNGHKKETNESGEANFTAMPIKKYRFTVNHSDYKKETGVIEKDDFKEGKVNIGVVGR